MNAPVTTDRYREDIKSELRAILEQYELPLYGMMRYHLGWCDEKGNPARVDSGKAIRPLLCLLACRAVGGDYRDALPAAAALELVHNYSLIHDDIQDDDEERRHRPSVWKIWGKPQAINAGTAMRVIAGAALFRMRGRVDDAKLLRCIALLDETTLRLIEGQYLDLSFEDRFDITVEEYLRMIGGKTGALIACATEMGAIVGGGDENVIESLRAFGAAVGRAFQIRDDMLGIWGEASKTGKPRGSDIRRKKKSLPIVFALTCGDQAVGKRMREIYSRQAVSEEAASEVSAILDEVGAREAVGRMFEASCARAEELLAAAPIDGAARVELESVMRFLARRDY